MQTVWKWLRYALVTLLVLLGLGLLAFSYVAWWGLEAYRGRRNERNSYRVQQGMHLRQALAIMGPMIFSDDKRTLYIYPASPFASDDICLSVAPDSTVLGISHGE